MKKFLKRIFEMMILFSCLFYNFCYADVIDPNFPSRPSPRVPNPEVPEPIIENSDKFVPLIVVGVIVVIVVVAVVVFLEKNAKKNNKAD